MNALILCAGSARRFFPAAASRPKCLLPLNARENLLDRLLRQTRAAGYNAVLGTGCGDELVKSHLENRGLNDVRCVFNDEYATTNSIVTLWKAREFIGDDTLVINGDVALPDDAFSLFQNVSEPQLLVKFQPNFDDDTYRVLVDERREIVRMGKELRDESSPVCAAFTGVSRVGDARKFLREIEKLLQNGTRQTWPTTAYSNLIGEIALRIVDLGAREFYDIDTPDEYSIARRAFADTSHAVTAHDEINAPENLAMKNADLFKNSNLKASISPETASAKIANFPGIVSVDENEKSSPIENADARKLDPFETAKNATFRETNFVENDTVKSSEISCKEVGNSSENKAQKDISQ